ncbi:MAG: glutamate 5-kinase [Parcubacteria group bacterium]
MSEKSPQKIVVKIGTNVITQDSGLLDEKNIKSLAHQAVKLKQKGYDVIVVSSGAVGAGRSIVPTASKADRVIYRQVLAATGQVELVNTYAKYFTRYDLKCSQVLVTKEDFRDRQHYLNIKNCLGALLHHNIVPIINENDAVAINELMFTDNDELAVLVASMVDADKLIILTDVDGVYKGCPVDGRGEVIEEIKPDDENLPLCEKPNQKSKMGRGGILTKVTMARRAADLGITTYVANGKKKGILPDLLVGKAICTTFIPQRKASSVKKWMAHTKGQEKGVVYINQGAEEVLTSQKKIASLLPVGVIKIEGDFVKGDIVKIKGEKDNDIGVGVAQYDTAEANKVMGQKGAKPLVRYDYLYLEP